MVATLTANGDKRGEGRLDLSREREEWRPNMAATGTKGTRAGEVTKNGRDGDKWRLKTAATGTNGGQGWLKRGQKRKGDEEESP